MNRRDLLKQMASAGLLLPFGQQLLSPAFAAGAAGKKLIILYYPAGGLYGQWHYDDLNSWMQEPLQPFKSQIKLIKNLTLAGTPGAHIEVRADSGGIGSKLWCGSLNGNANSDACITEPSFDFQLAKALGQKPINLAIGIRQKTDDVLVENQMSSSDQQVNGKHSYIIPIDDPQKGFDTYVGDGGGPVTNDPRLLMLEAAQQDFSRLQSKALSVTEKAKADAYAQALTELKTQIEANLGNSGSTGGSFSRPTSTLADALAQSTGQTAATRAHLDTIVAALSQGKQRVASFCLGTYSDQGDNQFALNAPEIRELHQAKFGGGYINWRHGASHNDTNSVQSHIRWISTQLAYLLGKLQAASLLDSTLVVLTTEINAKGPDGDGDHSPNELPWLIAGGGVNSNSLDANRNNHRALFVGLAQSMGLGWTKFGDSNGVIPV